MPEYSRVDFSELIPDVRQQIVDCYENDPDKYDQVDIEKVEQDDWTCLRFIKWNRGDPDKAIEQLNSCLQWRREYGINHRSEADLPKEFVKAGAIFPYGVDNHNRQLLYMRIKVYKKVPQLIEYFRQFVIGVIDRVDSESGPKGYVLVFDLTGVGFANADMEFLQFLINIFRNYFPCGLRYVIVYNLPRLLRPLWSAARLLVGSQQKIIKFANGDEIKDLIPVEKLPRYLGGMSDMDFTVAPVGCKSVQELGPKYGFTDAEVEKYLKMFEPHMKEAQNLVRGSR